jgi:hypothetical protein
MRLIMITAAGLALLGAVAFRSGYFDSAPPFPDAPGPVTNEQSQAGYAQPETVAQLTPVPAANAPASATPPTTAPASTPAVTEFPGHGFTGQQRAGAECRGKRGGPAARAAGRRDGAALLRVQRRHQAARGGNRPAEGPLPAMDPA